MSTESALDDPGQVRVGPLGGSPRRDLRQVRAEVDRLELVMNKLPDIPGKIVVAEKVKIISFLEYFQSVIICQSIVKNKSVRHSLSLLILTHLLTESL